MAAALLLVGSPAPFASTAGAQAAKPKASSTAKKPKPSTTAKKPPAPRTVATVGSARKVDTLDIQRAAQALSSDPLRIKDEAAWRRMLLDRSVDRELLAIEAERLGLDKDPALAKRVADREYAILLRKLYEKVLIPGITPTKEQLAEIRAAKLHRGVDLHYLLVRDDASGSQRAMAERIYQAARKGAAFDSLVYLYSGHPPSRAAKGYFGWVLAKDLDPASREHVKNAKPGDVVGIYSGPYGHEIYKIGAFHEPSEDSLFTLVTQERRRGISRDYEDGLLRKYHFRIDSTQVDQVMFVAGSETPDSILASLGPDGTRPERGVRPALGILATCDGAQVTMEDMIRGTPPVVGRTGRMRIRDTAMLYQLCARAVLPELTLRDIRERGLDKDPGTVREVRLSKDRILTEAMVERNRPALPGEADLRAYHEKTRDHYTRPKTAVTRVVVVANRDTAEALHARARALGSLPESLLVATGRRGTRAEALYRLPLGVYASLPLTASEGDPLGNAAVRATPGTLLPLTPVSGGFAVAQVLSIEEARPMSFEEASSLVRRSWLEDAESRWIETQLASLRTKIPVRVQPGMLESVDLASVLSSAGGKNP
ncbi:MAG TPA: peptidyl-prolyl cis-trans isomerase [Candidatus Eisenbacteria bacterium]|nr:peptidyl-prolyl cis-trans isomerase [Candidatus Eisenbacteria bacterium]